MPDRRVRCSFPTSKAGLHASGGNRSPLWTPVRSSLLLADYDPNVGVGVSGANILTWARRDGTGFGDLTAANNPTLVANVLNGRPCARFVGSSNQRCAVTGLTPYNSPSIGVAIVATLASTVTASSARFVTAAGTSEQDNSGANSCVLLGRSTTTQAVRSNGVGVGTASPAVTYDIPFIYSMRADGAFMTNQVDGGTKSPTACTAAFILTRLCFGVGLGAAGFLTTASLFGDIFRVLLFFAMSDSDMDKAVGYLAWDHALTGNLPASHPYKTTPPRMAA